MKLSEHFTLEELTFSDTAARYGLSNEPTARILENLRDVLAPGLEQVRALLGCPVLVSSGFRSESVNAAVGGSIASQHRFGLAADFRAPDFGTPLEVAKAIEASAIQYDQLILEFGCWVHISFVNRPPRREALSIYKAGKYLPGLVERS